MCSHIHTQTHACTHTHIQTHSTHMHTLHVNTHVNTHAHTHVTSREEVQRNPSFDNRVWGFGIRAMHSACYMFMYALGVHEAIPIVVPQDRFFGIHPGTGSKNE